MEEDDWELQAAIAMSLGQDVGAVGGVSGSGDGNSTGPEPQKKKSRTKGQSTSQAGAGGQSGPAGTSSTAAQQPETTAPAEQPRPPPPGSAATHSQAAVPVAAAAQPSWAAPPQATGASNMSNMSNLQSLAQALMQAVNENIQGGAGLPGAGAGAAGGTGGPAPFAAAASQQGFQFRRTRAPPAPAPAWPPTPGWIKDFMSWTLPMRTPSATVKVPADRPAAAAALHAILGIEVKFSDSGADAVAPVATTAPASAVDVQVGPGGELSDAAGSLALRSALTRTRTAGSKALAGLCAAFQRAQGVSSTDQAFVEFWKDRIAQSVFDKLKTDVVEDLYFEGGRDRIAFRKLLASGGASTELLARAVDTSVPSADAAAAATDVWRDIMRGAFDEVTKFEFSATDAAAMSAVLSPLAAMTSHPPLLRLLASMLLKEVVDANAPSSQPGRQGGRDPRAWSKRSLMAPLLGITTYLDPSMVRHNVAIGKLEGGLPSVLAEVPGYPRNRGNAEPQLQAAQASVERAHSAAHAIFKRIATARTFSSPAFPDAPDPHATPAAAGKEVTLAWLATAMHACEPRLEGGEKAVLHQEYVKLGAPDGFALGVCAVALGFVTPVLSKCEAAPGDMLPKLAPAAALAGMKRRLGNLADSRRLAAPPDAAVPSTVAADADEPDDAAAPAAGAAAAPLEFRFARAELAPTAAEGLPAPSFIVECTYLAVRALQVGLLPSVHRANELVHSLSQQLSAAMSAAGVAEGRAPPASESPAGRLYDQVLLVEDCQRAALLREGPAVAATRLLGLVLGVVHAALAPGASPEEAAAVPEPMVRDVLIFAGYVIFRGAPDLFAASQNLHPSMLALAEILRSKRVTSAMTRSAIVDLLRAMLQGARGSGRGASLAPPPMRPGASALTEALFRTVSDAGVVPALMVAYSEADAVEGLDVDKYHFDKFTMRHNVDVVLRELWKDEQCLKDLMAMAEPGGPEYQTLYDFLRALLNDLSYLMDDSFDRIADVQSIAAAQADAAQWAGLAASERATKERFKQSQIATASGFMGMAMTTVSLLLSLVRHAPIRRVFSEPAAAAHAAHLCLHLLQQLLVARDGGKDLTECADMRWSPNDVLAHLVNLLTQLASDPSFVKVLAGETAFSEKTLRTACTRLEALEWQMQMAGTYAARLQDTLAEVLAIWSQSAQQGASVVDQALALPLPDIPDDLEEAYREAVLPLAYGTFDHSAPGAFLYDLAKRVKATAGAPGSRQRQKRLMRELRALQAEDNMMVAPAASVFVRSDEERLDVVRSCITGPEDTPYAHGLFFFDALFPQDYPAIPPLLLLETTGGGRVRFNPNLYADGKVCLSLLGTWHGSASEKWDPAASSLWQVLVSIQAMVFVPDPYFNEPNVEQMRQQAEGIAASRHLNTVLSINTVQWAMVDVLRHPRPGFEAVIRTHFRMLRPKILRTCRRWLNEADEAGEQGQVARERLAAAVLELNSLLAAL
eukprot:jgi/Ulvmu1/6096/UM027_0074.1